MQREIELPRGRQAPARARRAIVQWYGQRLERGELDDARLFVSELVTNALVHGVGRTRLRTDVDEDAFFWKSRTKAPASNTRLVRCRSITYPAGAWRSWTRRRAGVAVGEVLEFGHGRSTPGACHSRPAKAEREDLCALALGNWHQSANTAAMFANSRLSDWCCDSNSSSGIPGAWNIVKLNAVRPSGNWTARVGKIAI